MTRRHDAASAGGGHAAGRGGGFTLLEIIVVIGIISVLVSLMLPALQKCRSAGRNLKCAMQLQKVGFEFRLFADDFAAQSRGDGETLGPRFFFLEDFQEKMYGVDEWWDAKGASRVGIDPTKTPMVCPEGNPKLQKRAKRPCSEGAVYPKENVSFGFNRRLHRPGPVMQTVVLSSKILDNPDVPLVMDVDGVAAVGRGQDPYYIAAPTIEADGYERGEYWFPGLRHGDRVNVGFVGGHVESSRHPDAEPAWKWAYQPESP